MTRLTGSAPRNKYGSRAVCSCGHPRDCHWERLTIRPSFGACRDIACDCEQYRKAYDSQAEAARGAELELLERAGQIWDLRRQVRYPQPFDDETEEYFRAKWLELIGLYEAEHPGAVPPLLELDATLNLRPVWPKR